MSYATWLQNIVHEYQKEFDVDVVDLDVVTDWAVRTKRYTRSAPTVHQQCRRELAAALRTERHIDPQGRVVRTMHSVKKKIKVQGEQITMWEWADIRTAEPMYMQLSLQQRRQGILAGVKQHKIDWSSYNENNRYAVQLNMFDYNFNLDLEESELPTEYDEDAGFDEDEE